MTEVGPWWVRSQPLRQRRGADIFERLYGQTPVATLLESPYPALQVRNSRYSICAGGPRRRRGQVALITPPLGQVLPALRHLPVQGSPPLLGPEASAAAELPFAGGWLGWLGYDLAWEIEQLPRLRQDPLPFPVAYWYEPESFAVADHQQQQLWLGAETPQRLEVLERQLGEASPQPAASNPLGEAPLQLAMDRKAYEAAVEQAKAHIRAGDIFQANLSLRFGTRTRADSWSLYRRLQGINPSPFACYYRSPWGSLISCSPERLVQRCDRTVSTRPIAGTRPRGRNPAQDQQLAAVLRHHPKEIAEHVMLVDLERNDLGRVCTWGSVQVDELLVLEYYSHVMHLVSNVVGTLDATYDSIDLIQAVFPGGTITGCPKVRCMEIIEALEPVRRSLFYGSCGYIDSRGHLDLNILIRTLLMEAAEVGEERRVWGQVGAGIVADSDPHREWRESLQKARAQLLALGFSCNLPCPQPATQARP